ncbi:hypothetical protein LOCC1_G005054 [Lachnellula occidentalis]|uniref:Centrosomin N-terminal motif 1 domain-containing protein n=1 Tax=Lachnellula occidentalis TaxID=215460 RepID=A0A8H8UHN6_9HELO|nr:hypothetical protein LOCC1_G005054 [Lachnellula occidentalis]
MEDRSQRSRPESSNSANTRMTPTSSNSSSAHLPARAGNINGTRAPSSGGASLLHERLRERKVESARQSRRQSVDTSNGEKGVHSSPGKASGGRGEERRSSASGLGMGVKQIEEQVSTLHKQNFDLKLELFHRRQRQDTLEHKLQEAEKQINEQAELQEVNEELLSELEKRDQAVEEAVNIIVKLEEKVERLMKERESVRSFEADYESTYFRPSHHGGLPSSSSQFDHTQLRPQKSVPRMPSFLSEPSQGVEALRSLYLPYSESTLAKMTEGSRDGSPEQMDSPRLSVLSESSFISVYGEKKFQLDAPEDETELPRRRQRSSTSVENWIDERPVRDITPVNPSARNSVLQKKGYLSINDVLESPLQRLEKLKHTLEKANGSLVSQAPSKEKRKARETPRLLSTGTHSFDRQHTLPPTPDTISTDTLRNFKNSNDAILQHRKASGTFLNSTSTFPTPRQYQSDMSLRPRSAGETIMSRREGHGWDTENQEEFTETGSISSTNSTYNGTSSYQYPTRARTPPDLFSFRGGGDSWGRDVKFNNSSRLPAHPAHRYEQSRRSSMVNHPQSDDTVIAYQSQFKGNERPEVHPPDRRSSLAATTKLRKTEPPNNSPTATATTSSPLPSPEKDTGNRRSRFATRFFIKSEKPPIMRSQSYVPEEEARATPPPIKRNRTVAQIPRPSSVGGHRLSEYNGATDEVVDGDMGKSFGGGKKWFGMGRTNSLRRN